MSTMIYSLQINGCSVEVQVDAGMNQTDAGGSAERHSGVVSGAVA